jgi:putative transposase
MRRKLKELPDVPLAPVPSEILDQFVRQGPISHEELDAAVRRFKKAIIERALGGELTHHWATHRVAASQGRPPITAMGRAARRFSPTTGRCRSTCRAIARARSSRA